MQTLVAGRHTVGVAVVPIAPDIVRCLEAVIGYASFLEALDGGDSAGAGANHTAQWAAVIGGAKTVAHVTFSVGLATA